MKITYCHIICKMCCLSPIYIVMKQDHKVKSISGDLYMNMLESVYGIIFLNSTPTNIIEKIYTHSMQGFF